MNFIKERPYYNFIKAKCLFDQTLLCWRNEDNIPRISIFSKRIEGIEAP